jgi:hypothetical protein
MFGNRLPNLEIGKDYGSELRAHTDAVRSTKCLQVRAIISAFTVPLNKKYTKL